MQTISDDKALKALKQEFESYSLLFKEFPWKFEYQKKADALELIILSKEVDNKYI